LSEAFKAIDFSACFYLSPPVRRGFSGGQPVHIKCWALAKIMLCCCQFIERTKRTTAVKIKVVRFKIIPGDRGKVGSGWLTRLL
jgi:hypothetical protein